MKIIMLVSVSRENGLLGRAGEIIDLDDNLAKELIANGQAKSMLAPKVTWEESKPRKLHVRTEDGDR